jgi:hypothetical protein
LQAKLADHNLLVDKLNTDTEVILVQQESQEMASQNEADSRDVDSIFAEKQGRQSQIQRLEQEVLVQGSIHVVVSAKAYTKPPRKSVH